MKPRGTVLVLQDMKFGTKNLSLPYKDMTPLHDLHDRRGENKSVWNKILRRQTMDQTKARRAFPVSRMRVKHYETEN